MIARRTLARLLAALAAAQALWADAVEVRFERVAENTYAHVGDIGARSVANEGLNANLGLVVTPAGAVLIDSGATFSSARDIHAAIRRVTGQPVRWVINTGGQDHRWLGNGYFEAQGAELIAHAAARSQTLDYLEALRTHMKRAVEHGVDVGEAVMSFNVRPFLQLSNAAELNPGNASRT